MLEVPHIFPLVTYGYCRWFLCIHRKYFGLPTIESGRRTQFYLLPKSLYNRLVFIEPVVMWKKTNQSLRRVESKTFMNILPKYRFFFLIFRRNLGLLGIIGKKILEKIIFWREIWDDTLAIKVVTYVHWTEHRWLQFGQTLKTWMKHWCNIEESSMFTMFNVKLKHHWWQWWQHYWNINVNNAFFALLL